MNFIQNYAGTFRKNSSSNSPRPQLGRTFARGTTAYLMLAAMDYIGRDCGSKRGNPVLLRWKRQEPLSCPYSEQPPFSVTVLRLAVVRKLASFFSRIKIGTKCLCVSDVSYRRQCFSIQVVQVALVRFCLAGSTTQTCAGSGPLRPRAY